MKQCTKCKLVKQLNQFVRVYKWYRNICKECRKIHLKNLYPNGYKPKPLSKEEYRLKTASWRSKNKEKNNEYNRLYREKRRKNDIIFRIASNLRSRVSMAIKRNKNGSAIKDLGCTVGELKLYLESKFQPGMNWDNYGKWHIDHIKPLSSFDLTNNQNMLIACNYKNLQPLWAFDNLSKSDHIAL